MQIRSFFKQIIMGTVLGSALTITSVFAQPTDLKSYGSANAPVKIYLFSSFTCPHCTIFHQDILPALKEQFIATGKLHLVLVDMPQDLNGLLSTLAARCIEPDLYEAFTEKLYANQTDWSFSHEGGALIKQYAQEVGADMKALATCAVQTGLRKKIFEQKDNLSSLYKVMSMPTVVIIKNGKIEKLSGTDKKVILSKIQSVVEE